MAYLGNGIYDLLDVVRASKNPQINYEGLYQDAPSNIATSNLFQAMQPGYEYRNSNFINNLIDKSGFDLSGNVPIDFNRQVDFKNYFNNEPLRSNYESLARFQNFNPRVGNITPLVKNTDPLNVKEGIIQQALTQNFEFLSSAYEDENEDDQQVDYLPGQPKSFRDSATLQEYFQNRNPLKGIGGLLGLITGNPIFGLISGGARGLGALNNKMQNSMFGKSNNLAEYFNNRKIAKATGSKDFMNRPESERNYTGPGGGDNTGGDVGSKGAADTFSNKSGMGRTGY
jgi:hypothetical protein